MKSGRARDARADSPLARAFSRSLLAIEGGGGGDIRTGNLKKKFYCIMFKVIEALISDANTGNTKQLSGREKLLGLSRNGPQGPVVRRPGTQPGVKF